MSKEEVEMLMGICRFIEERIERLSFELEVLRHALERVKNILAFEEAMKK